MTKKIILSLLLSLSLMTVVPQLSFALTGGSNSGLTGGSNGGLTGGSNSGGIKNPLKGNPDLNTLLKNILHLVFLIGTMVAVFFIVYAGFKYVTAGGDPKAIETAHSMLLWAAVGTAILLGAQVIVDVISNTVSSLAK